MIHTRNIAAALAASTCLTAAARPRGLVSTVRADASDPNAMLGELNKAFHAFKDANDARLAELEKRGAADVVTTEKVDRINANMTEIQATIDGLLEKIAAAQIGSGERGQAQTAEQRAYATAFNRFFRRGVEDGLAELAVKAALQSDSSDDGGYLLPPAMEGEITRLLPTVSAMRQLAQVISISTPAYRKPINRGGAASGWVGERDSRTETDTPTVNLLTFPAMELYANPAATQTMLDDGMIDIAAWLADEVSITFAEAEGLAFCQGNGVDRPRGITQYDTVADASWAWGSIGYIASGVAAALSDSSNNGIDALISMVYGLKQGYRGNAAWLMNKSTVSTVRKLKSATEELYLWQPPVAAGQPATLLGYPLADDDNMPDIAANAYPIGFGDWRRAYVIVDRVGTRVLRDPFTNKPYVHFYTTKRVGGGVQNYEAVKLLKVATS